ncbi:pre-RNA processing PIH1/Nop17-domain-containing protein [Dichotomocladium elegans]|nr:pre-RNA processing PIH1/Nop17-domain-containing protein [Dichotomocladium elegans]
MPTLELLPDTEPSHPFLLNQDAHKIAADSNFDNLSEEEKSALLDHVAAEFAQDPKAMDRLAAQFLREVKTNDFHDVPVQPQPGYICKTKVVRADDSKSQCKEGMVVYINVCHAGEIPAPPVMPESEVQKALHAEPDAAFRVPVSLGQMRRDGDSESLIFDACIHTLPYTRSEHDLDFRLYILELCIELVEERLSVELSRGIVYNAEDGIQRANTKAHIATS